MRQRVYDGKVEPLRVHGQRPWFQEKNEERVRKYIREQEQLASEQGELDLK